MPGRSRLVWTFAVTFAAVVILLLALGGFGPMELVILSAWTAAFALVAFLVSRIRAR